MQKYAVLLLTSILTLLIQMEINPIEAAIAKPSVPEFSLKLVRYSADTPAVYGTDPYTGENVTITPAKHQESTEIVIIIKNQPFTPYKDTDGNWIDLSYVVRSKGHFSDDWSEGGVERDPYNDSYTLTTESASYYPANAQVDFQVKAMIGYSKDTGLPSIYQTPPIFYGESSEWSATQTITISNSSLTMPNTSSTPSTVTPNASDLPQSLTQTSPQPNVGSSVWLGLDWVGVAVIVLLAVVVVLLVFMVVFLRRRAVG